MEGLVIRNTGSAYAVKLDDGRVVDCKVKGNFRIKGIRTTNPVAVGDIVNVEPAAGDFSFITAVKARKNYIIRRASNLSKESHIIASNIDLAVLVVSFAQPTTATVFIDRFLATAEAYRVPALIVVNKCDLHDDEWTEYFEAFKYLYESIGYKVIAVSARTGEGVDSLKDELRDKLTLFSGNSGVGKSSLINSIIPDLNLKTASISAAHKTGMHTTTFSQMYPLDFAPGYIIDTPGVKGFGTIDFKKEEVGHYFPEIFKTATDCKYSNCMHLQEPGCAVKVALDESRISQSRYASYLSILDDIDPDKYRKPF